MNATKEIPPKGQRWRKFYISECPICGSGKTYWHYEPLPKPGIWTDRYEIAQNGGCSSHWL